MGLDTVEIVMATEAAFNIEISDGEAETIVTPRQLIKFVMTKIAAAETGVCVTQRAFHLLCRSFVSHQLLTRQQIRPGTELALAFPRQQRAEQLRQLSSELAVDPFPPPVRAGWLKAMLAGLSLTTGLTVAVALSQAPFSVLPPEIFGPLAALAVGVFGAWTTRRFRTEFPRELRTTGEAARWVAMHKAGLAGGPKDWTREQVALRVRMIFVELLGVASIYHEDARIIEDFGAD